jgi:hypothetical protein
VTDVVRLDDYIRYLFILVAQPIELDARHACQIAKNVYCQSIIYSLTFSSVSVKTPVPPVGDVHYRMRGNTSDSVTMYLADSWDWRGLPSC